MRTKRMRIEDEGCACEGQGSRGEGGAWRRER